MKKNIIILGMFLCFLGCSFEDHPYRIVKMENGEYVIQHKAPPCFGWKNSIGWVTYVDASVGSYRFKTKLEVSEVYSMLVEQYREKKRANTVKEILK